MSVEINYTQGDFILDHGEQLVECPYQLAHRITNAKIITHLQKCRKEYKKTQELLGKKVEMRTCPFNAIHVVPHPELDFHKQRCPDQHKVVSTLVYHQSEPFQRKLQEDEERRREQERELKEMERERRHKHKHHSKDRDRERKHKHRKHDKEDKERRESRDYEDADRVVRDYGHGHGHSSRGGFHIKQEPDWGERDNGNGRRKPEKKEEKKAPEPDNIWGSDAEDWDAETKDTVEPAYDPQEKLKEKVVMYVGPAGLTKSERKQFREEQRLRARTSSEDQEVRPNMQNLNLNTMNVKEEPRDWNSLTQWPGVNIKGKKPPPKVNLGPPKDDEKEDGECSEDEYQYKGEDPFDGF